MGHQLGTVKGMSDLRAEIRNVIANHSGVVNIPQPYIGLMSRQTYRCWCGERLADKGRAYQDHVAGKVMEVVDR